MRLVKASASFGNLGLGKWEELCLRKEKGHGTRDAKLIYENKIIGKAKTI